MQRLFQHQLQNDFEGIRICRIEKGANAMQRSSHVFVDAHPNDEGFDQDAFRLEGATHRTWVLVASFDAISDQNDDIPAFHVGKVVSSFFKGACNGCRSFRLDSSQLLFDVPWIVGPKGHHKFRVVTILSSWDVRGSMAIHAKSKFQFADGSEFREGFAQKLGRGLNLALSSPKGIHAVGRVKHKQNPCDSRRGVRGHLGPRLIVNGQSQGHGGKQEFHKWSHQRRGSLKHVQEVSSPPTKIQVDSVRWRVDRRWAQCHAICGCPP